ncbi:MULTISPECIES: DNA alkylation repair protein [Chryseobacterium]|uniref:DNA alkylation repair protein n=1 Tax=Chryseobacterium TaxID=59732 RepID=UPI00195DED14|nr:MULTISPECIES: DNA alkylation repair protein [Chryseobacterium]MBM7420409.1 hypothetical protein [Chryseobacterium sp. JUb44]MDH6210356.1 hypothetical protein [Chryseobacterium sp. BIGb0186]WSO09065.1 DNA alkylation repair protein [Chryseobacterium scophthalmum]
MNELLENIVKIEHGFKHIIEAGNLLLKNDGTDHLPMAKRFIETNQVYQIRMLGVYMLGEISHTNPVALHILKNSIPKDKNWRVQEMLAKAFDSYCKHIGYEYALPEIESWINNENTNIKRAVTEGLRIWTSRDFFKQHPEIAIELISRNKLTDSEYLSKSIGNSLRDIRKKHPEAIEKETSKWDVNHHKIQFILKLINK